MATFIDPNTMQVHPSINTPDGEARGWLLVTQAELDAIPAADRTIDNGALREMTSDEKAARDVAALAAAKQSRRDLLWGQAWAFVEQTYPTRSQLQMVFLALEAMALGYTQRLATILQSYGAAAPVMLRWAQAVAAIDAAESVQAVNAITLDTSGITIPYLNLAELAGVQQ